MASASDVPAIERAGKLEKTDVRFVDNAHVMRIIDKIVSQIGRRVDEASPMVDARLPDGSRRITHVTEVLRMESDVITLQDIFLARPPDEEHNPSGGRGRLLSPLQCTGLKPQFLEKLAANGVVLPPSFFGDEEDSEAPRPAFAATSFNGAFQ